MDRLEKRHIEIRSDEVYWWDNGSGYKIDRLQDLKRYMTAQEIEDCIKTSRDSEGFTTVYWNDNGALYKILRYRESWNTSQNVDKVNCNCAWVGRTCTHGTKSFFEEHPEEFVRLIEIALSGRHG